MRHTTLFGRGGRRRLSRWYVPSGFLAPAVRAIRNFAWKIGHAARRPFLSNVRWRGIVGRPRRRNIVHAERECVGDRRP